MRQIAILIFAVAIFVSCTDNNDNLDTALQGQWTLTNASCFCGFGNNPDFSGHKITFDSNNLTVENSGEFKFLTNAEGSYTVDGNVITLKNGQQYTYIIKVDILELTFVDEPNVADDELFLEYRRGN